MDTGKLLLIGGIGVGGYFAYQWYYGAGGYQDQQACGAGLPASSAQVAAAAAQIWTMAAAQNMTALDFLVSIKSSYSDSAADLQKYACARVAVTQYPSLALAQAAAASTSSAAAASTTTGTVATTTAPANQSTVVPPVAPNPAASSATLDGMYTTLKNNVSSDSFFSGSGDSLTSSVDHWNVYLQRLVPTQIPGGMFSNVSGDDPNNLTAAQYWAVMAPWVASTMGLSGLGMYGGLGAVVRRYRR